MIWVNNILYDAIKITCVGYRQTSALEDINDTLQLLEWQVCSLVNCHMPLLLRFICKSTIRNSCYR